MIAVEGLLSVVLYIAILGLIFGVLWWMLGQFGLPEPFNKVARVLLAVIAAVLLIYLLLGMLPGPPRLLR